MKPKARFIHSVTDAAKGAEIALPWKRGARRTAFIAKRRLEKGSCVNG